MRRFFTMLFIISILGVGAAYYWRTYQPEKTVVLSESGDEGEDSAIPTQKRSFSPRSRAPEAYSPQSTPVLTKEPSDRQDLAMMISLVASVISALAAVFQTWITARSVQGRL